MQWEYLWLRLAIDTEKTTQVRVIETSKRLEWSAYQQPYVFDPMPMGGTVTAPTQGGYLHSSEEQLRTPLGPDVWAACLDSLGSNGWELASMAPLSGDTRIARYEASVAGAGRHDVQLWIFKRPR